MPAPIAASRGAALASLGGLGRRVRVVDDPPADVQPDMAAGVLDGADRHAQLQARDRGREADGPAERLARSALDALMTFMAASLGAPVTDPGGNIAATSSPSPTSWRRRPATSETRCQTPA